MFNNFVLRINALLSLTNPVLSIQRSVVHPLHKKALQYFSMISLNSRKLDVPKFKNICK